MQNEQQDVKEEIYFTLAFRQFSPHRDLCLTFRFCPVWDRRTTYKKSQLPGRWESCYVTVREQAGRGFIYVCNGIWCAISAWELNTVLSYQWRSGLIRRQFRSRSLGVSHFWSASPLEGSRFSRADGTLWLIARWLPSLLFFRLDHHHAGGHNIFNTIIHKHIDRWLLWELR